MKGIPCGRPATNGLNEISILTTPTSSSLPSHSYLCSEALSHYKGHTAYHQEQALDDASHIHTGLVYKAHPSLPVVLGRPIPLDTILHFQPTAHLNTIAPVEASLLQDALSQLFQFSSPLKQAKREQSMR